MADSGSVEGGRHDGRADADDGGTADALTADALNDGGAACRQRFLDPDDWSWEVAHTLVIRLDADLQILDFVHLMSEPCRYGDCLGSRCGWPCYTGRPSEEDARDRVLEAVDLSAGADLLREDDVYVFLDVPDPDGQVAVITASTPWQVAFASMLSTEGPATLQWPLADQWRDAEALGLGCEPDDAVAGGRNLVDGSELDGEVVEPVMAAVTATAGWQLFQDLLGNSVVLRYPRSVEEDGGTSTAAWVVIRTAYPDFEG